MAQIRIDTERVRDVGRRLIAEGDRLNEIGHELQGAISGLDIGVWDGHSRAQAGPLLGRVLPESARVSEGLDELGRMLVRVADAFEQEDNTAARNLEGMPWVDFTLETPGAEVIIIGGAVIIAGYIALLWWNQQNLEGLSRDQAWEILEGILKKKPVGSNTIRIAQDLGVKFELSSPGQGSWYDAETNTMRIDPSAPPDLVAEACVHEVTHAKQHAENRFPDPHAIGRDEFIEKKIGLEAEAHIAEFEYEKERWFLDHVYVRPEEEAYWEAYEGRLKELGKSHPDMSEGERHQLAYEAGKEQVLDYYRNGSLKTSTTKQSYVDYYGEAWDRENPGSLDGKIPPNLA